MGNTGLKVIKSEYNNLDEWISHDIKDAQKTINQPNFSKTSAQWQQGMNLLLKSLVKTNFHGGDFIGNAVKSILDWHDEISLLNKKIFYFYNKKVYMLKKWQVDLFGLIKEKNISACVYTFEDKFWVVLDRPTTKIVHSYFCLYENFLKSNKETIIDFFVFSKKEISCYDIPENANILEVNPNAQC